VAAGDESDDPRDARIAYLEAALATAPVVMASPRRYQRRAHEAGPLYCVVNDHLAAVLEHARIQSKHGYPRFIEREFEQFLDCGLLCRGFVRVRCDTCATSRARDSAVLVWSMLCCHRPTGRSSRCRAG